MLFILILILILLGTEESLFGNFKEKFAIFSTKRNNPFYYKETLFNKILRIAASIWNIHTKQVNIQKLLKISINNINFNYNDENYFENWKEFKTLYLNNLPIFNYNESKLIIKL